jgi:hypothetical protein
MARQFPSLRTKLLENSVFCHLTKADGRLELLCRMTKATFQGEMNMSTTATRKTAKQERKATIQTIGSVKVLWLTTDRLITAYKLSALDHGFGLAAFRLAKADCGDGNPEVYDVLLDGARSTCECLGFLKHHHCKHLESLLSLIAAGKLAIPQQQPAREPGDEDSDTWEATEQPPAPRQPWCERCQDNPNVFCSECTI